jgi:hypothetical protein
MLAFSDHNTDHDSEVADICSLSSATNKQQLFCPSCSLIIWLSLRLISVQIIVRFKINAGLIIICIKLIESNTGTTFIPC